MCLWGGQGTQWLCRAGTNFMLLNGMFVDPESNIYDLVDSIRKEVSLLSASCKHVYM